MLFISLLGPGCVLPGRGIPFQQHPWLDRLLASCRMESSRQPAETHSRDTAEDREMQTDAVGSRKGLTLLMVILTTSWLQTWRFYFWRTQNFRSTKGPGGSGWQSTQDSDQRQAR